MDIAIGKQLDEYFPRKFYCRKGMCALPFQAVVDSPYKIMYMAAKCAVSTHEQVAFAISSLGTKLRSRLLLTGYWIARDAAYQCLSSILAHWTAAEIRNEEHVLSRDEFNFNLSSL